MASFILKHQWLFVLFSCVLLFVLWLPGLKYPILSDTAHYALLGKSFWQGNGYQLFGEPYAKHLPLHAITAYPFVWMLGVNLGMKTVSLLGGICVLIASFLLIKERFSSVIALLVVFILTFHHGFVWMTVVGSADLLFTALFLFGLFAYTKAEKNNRFYILAGVLWGLSCIARYNGVPLLGLFVFYGLFFRKKDRFSSVFLIGFLIEFSILLLWFIRNALILGSPFASEYTTELGMESAGPLQQLYSNMLYYGNPLHNILPILLIFGLYGIWINCKTQKLLLWSMVAVLLLTSIWWVQAMRFAFPAYPILIAFSVSGLFYAFKRYNFLIIPLIVLIVFSHAGALCMYSFGECNAWVDKKIGIVPANLGLTSEGFYSYNKAIEYINENAEEGAYVLLDSVKLLTWKHGVFRDDLILTVDESNFALYRITDSPNSNEEILFTSDVYPKTSVVLSNAKMNEIK